VIRPVISASRSRARACSRKLVRCSGVWLRIGMAVVCYWLLVTHNCDSGRR
jgi:hypothetical protein